MKIKFIAFDSLGVKSSCVLVETADCKICIDPGIAGEVNSFPLPALKRAALVALYKRKIVKACKEADVVTISHYHYDHHIPAPGLYEGKKLLIKDPERNINKSQRERAAYLLSLVEDKAGDIKIADDRTFRFGSTQLKFSTPLWHGMPGTALGKIIMLTIKEGDEKILHSSDVDGPYERKACKLMIKENPNLIILDGFPSYLLGFLAAFRNLEKAVKNTIYLIERTAASIILDHHLLRDYRYPELYYEAYRRARELEKPLKTVAELQGKKPAVLAGYAKHGPTRWKSWPRFTFAYLHKLEAHAAVATAKAKAKKAHSIRRRKV